MNVKIFYIHFYCFRCPRLYPDNLLHCIHAPTAIVLLIPQFCTWFDLHWKIYLMHFQHWHIKLIVKWMELTHAPPPPLQPCWSCSLNYRQLNPINATINWTEAKQAYKSVIRLLIFLMCIFYLCANLLNCIFFNLRDSVHMKYWKCKRNTSIPRNLKRFSRTIRLQEILINLQFFHRIKTDEILVLFSNSSFRF